MERRFFLWSWIAAVVPFLRIPTPSSAVVVFNNPELAEFEAIVPAEECQLNTGGPRMFKRKRLPDGEVSCRWSMLGGADQGYLRRAMAEANFKEVCLVPYDVERDPTTGLARCQMLDGSFEDHQAKVFLEPKKE